MNTNINNTLFSLTIVSQCLACQPKNQEADNTSQKTKPLNVVFILSDDHRYDYMGFMNTIPWLETPNMDRMAKEGAHIKNAFVTTSLSSPSRASILTGMYSHSHKVVMPKLKPGDRVLIVWVEGEPVVIDVVVKASGL